jgi:putative hydrolase of the HAD superfamily
MHQVKPSREIFEQILQEGGMKAEETLFIDDSKRNCEAAAALGFQTLHAKSLDYADNLPW